MPEQSIQTSEIGTEALIPNPALRRLEFLIGTWRTTGRHPLVPGKTLKGRTSFAWHEGGAFLIMQTEIDEPKFPSGIAIIGSDDTGAFTMIYFDERQVSRIYAVTIDDKTLTWQRHDPEMSQTLTITLGEGDSLESEGRISKNGGPWGDDLSQVFMRD